MTCAVQEMLQGWDGTIDIFPRCPKSKDAHFRNWRTAGIFSVCSKRFLQEKYGYE